MRFFRRFNAVEEKGRRVCGCGEIERGCNLFLINIDGKRNRVRVDVADMSVADCGAFSFATSLYVSVHVVPDILCKDGRFGPIIIDCFLYISFQIFLTISSVIGRNSHSHLSVTQPPQNLFIRTLNGSHNDRSTTRSSLIGLVEAVSIVLKWLSRYEEQLGKPNRWSLIGSASSGCPKCFHWQIAGRSVIIQLRGNKGGRRSQSIHQAIITSADATVSDSWHEMTQFCN